MISKKKLLTPLEYLLFEEKAKETAPNRILEACVASTFNFVNYPTEISTVKSAQRYIDTMHEGRFFDTLQMLGGKITPNEEKLVYKIFQKICLLSKKKYKKVKIPISSLFRALLIFRQIECLFSGKKIKVLEIGPGSGCLGALLIEAGHLYISTEVSQAFYIYQNHLYNALSCSEFEEMAISKSYFFPNGPKKGKIVHVPWWKFVLPSPSINFSVDVVTCNHALCELHPNALNYIALVSAKLLKGDGLKCFMFEGWGSTIKNSIWSVSKALTKADLAFVHNDIFASVLVRKDSKFCEKPMLLPKAGHFDGEAAYHPDIYCPEDSKICNELIKQREKIKNESTVGYEELKNKISKILKCDEWQSDDEKFLEFLSTKI